MRKICFILILIIGISGVFCVSCSDSDSGDDILPERSTPSEENETAEPRPVLPDKDYEGYEFVMQCAVRHPTIIPNYFTVESENGDVLNDAVYKRNLSAAEKYNVKITADTTGVSTAVARSAILAGDDHYDLMLGGTSVMGTLAFEKLLLDLNEMEFFNLDMPWWDTELNKGLTIANRLFFGSGSLITTNSDATYIVRLTLTWV